MPSVSTPWRTVRNVNNEGLQCLFLTPPMWFFKACQFQLHYSVVFCCMNLNVISISNMCISDLNKQTKANSGTRNCKLTYGKCECFIMDCSLSIFSVMQESTSGYIYIYIYIYIYATCSNKRNKRLNMPNCYFKFNIEDKYLVEILKLFMSHTF